LREAGITLLPEMPAKGVTAKTAISFVILFPDGQRAIATYPGNAREILKPELISETMIQQADALLVQGSLWQKLDWKFTDRLLDLCSKHGSELWLAMPTHARFGRDKGDHFLQAVCGASVVLGNEEELARIYQTTPQEALGRLQAALDRKEKPVGFITRGDKGAYVVTAEGVDAVDSASIRKEAIVNTLGAGDISFAGFVAGYLKKLPHLVSAQIAMALAGEKLKINGPRLPDPRATLQRARPDLAKQIL
jgi:sugar/nucleoside kinase (ribokinase family)